MSTPIYDALKAGEAWKAATRNRPPIILLNPVDDPARQPWPLEGTRITYEAEPRWRTFMRCLGWWKK